MERTYYNFPVESDHAGDRYRDEYLAGVEKLVKDKMEDAARQRKAFFAGYMKRPEDYRQEYIEMLGWPLTERRGRQAPEHIELEQVWQADGITLYRVQMEILPGVPLYGILFKNGDEKRPLVISQHGGGGTPELCSGLLERGTVNYNQMTQRVLRHGVHVFAPQLLIWDPAQFQTNPKEGEQTAQRRRALDQSLKMAGGSITALEVACLMGALDYFEEQPYVDAGRIGMVGLSYGGYYTQHMAAADTRIKAALTSCYFNKHDFPVSTDYDFYRDALRFMNSELAMLVYPRKLCIQIATDDEILPAAGAREEFARLKDYAGEQMGDWLRFKEFDGVHEFWGDEEQLEQFFADLLE